MNLKEISWQEAEALEPGTKLFVGQTREKAVEAKKGDHWFVTPSGGRSFGTGALSDPCIVRHNQRKRMKAKARTRHYNRLSIRKRGAVR